MLGHAAPPAINAQKIEKYLKEEDNSSREILSMLESATLKEAKDNVSYLNECKDFYTRPDNGLCDRINYESFAYAKSAVKELWKQPSHEGLLISLLATPFVASIAGLAGASHAIICHYYDGVLTEQQKSRYDDLESKAGRRLRFMESMENMSRAAGRSSNPSAVSASGPFTELEEIRIVSGKP
jgi:hypothetical protein